MRIEHMSFKACPRRSKWPWRMSKGQAVRTTFILLAALISAALAGCERVDRLAANENREVVVEAAARDARDAGDIAADTEVNRARDAALAAEISARLARDPDLSALGIDVDATGGRVVLQGSAPDLEVRDRATVLAWGVYGVVGVNNKMRAQNRD
jgi:hyperosmotically inducible protein